MATYLCDCHKPADWFFIEVGPDGMGKPGGKSWAACNAHAVRALPSMVGRMWKVSPVSRTWREHVERRQRERAALADTDPQRSPRGWQGGDS